MKIDDNILLSRDWQRGVQGKNVTHDDDDVKCSHFHEKMQFYGVLRPAKQSRPLRGNPTTAGIIPQAGLLLFLEKINFLI